MNTDGELLRRYAREDDQAAFSEVVRRYVDLAYSAAVRVAGGDRQLAQDVVQKVFTDLARKADGLSGHTTLAGWMHTSVRYAALDALRGERRRKISEQEAHIMRQESTTAEFSWEQLGPELDEAVGHLGETDRTAVLLRFFQDKSHEEIGQALGLTEDTARKRVERAVEKLRGHFSRRGITISAALLTEAVASNAVSAAPVGFAESLSTTALANAAAVPVGLAALAKIFITMTTTTKIILGAAAIIVAVASFQFFVRSPEVAPSDPSSRDTGQAKPASVAAAQLSSRLSTSTAAPVPVPPVAKVVVPAASGPSVTGVSIPGLANPATDAQAAQVMLVTMKQSFLDMAAAMNQSSDLGAIREKVNALQSQMDALQARAAGTMLGAQLTPAANALKAVQAALQKDDAAGVRQILQKLSAGGPSVPN